MYYILFRKIRKKYLFLSLLTFFSIFFSSILARNTEEVGGIFVITISMIPLIEIINRFLEKEIIHIESNKSKNIFIRHKDFIFAYFSIFFSAIFATYVSYILFPDIFKQQIKAIERLYSEIFRYSYVIRKDFLFSYILINNIKILLLFFFFSIIFGAGSVYLLLWNSSVIGVFLGKIAREYADGIFLKYFIIPLIYFIKVLPHGILEFLGYFLASLAGGILTMSILKSKNIEDAQQFLSDSLLLLLFSILFIFLGALIEIFL